MTDEKTIHFPFAGLDLSTAFCRQPPRNVGPDKSDYARSAPVGINVRGYDHEGRRRGGSRPGMSRYINARVNGAWVIQELAVIVTVTEAAVG